MPVRTIRMNSRILNEAVNNYVYDFQFTDFLGNITTTFQVLLKLSQDITYMIVINEIIELVTITVKRTGCS
jgi:hypothetical protein